MSIVNSIFLQAKKPTGIVGSLLARIMNFGHNKLTDWGLNFLNIKNDNIIMDIGCGGGRTVSKLAKIAFKGKVYGIDYSDESVRISSIVNHHLINQGIVNIQKSSVSSIPFSDNHFDIITAIETYFLWPELDNDLKEVLRVLKPQGKLLVVSEVYKSDKSTTWTEAINKARDVISMNIHTKEEFTQLFIRAGYINVEVHDNPEKGWICGIGTKAK
jgi:ubiquinone/menaquinone biosynthesis C-methylase UbiE